MHTACGGQKEGSDWGTPQTPAGGRRPPAPPAEEVQNTLSASLGNVDIRMHGHYTRGAQSSQCMHVCRKQTSSCQQSLKCLVEPSWCYADLLVAVKAPSQPNAFGHPLLYLPIIVVSLSATTSPTRTSIVTRSIFFITSSINACTMGASRWQIVQLSKRKLVTACMSWHAGMATWPACSSSMFQRRHVCNVTRGGSARLRNT